MAVGSTKSASQAAEMNRQQRLVEKEGRKRIEELQDQIKRTENDLQERLDQVRDQYERQITSESLKNENYLEEQRRRAADKQLDTSNEFRRQSQELQRRGERNIHEVQEAYKDKLSQTDQEGRRQLNETVDSYQARRDYEKRNQEQELSLRAAQHQLNMAVTRENQNQMIEKTQTQNVQEIARLQNQYMNNIERTEKKFDDLFQYTQDKNQTAMDRIQSHAAEKIQDIRADTAYKLASYASRQRDPFYRMLDMGVNLSEHADGFTVTATIPQHEQANITVNVKGNELVISGRRANQETLQLGEGHKQQTSSHQYYMETVPLSYPVDERALTRTFDGDRLIVQVPKKDFVRAKDFPYQAKSKENIEKIRAEKPQFPANIPDYREPRKPKN